MDIYDEASIVFAVRYVKMSENSMLKNMNGVFFILINLVVAILQCPFVTILMQGTPFEL